MKKKRKKLDWLSKLMDLVEKECALYDTRPKKERKWHPGGTCYMNDIIDVVFKEFEKLKKKHGKTKTQR